MSNSNKTSSSNAFLQRCFTILILSLLLLLYINQIHVHNFFPKLQLTPTTIGPSPTRFAVPPTWHQNVYHHSRYGPPITRQQSRNRAFVSALPRESSDGLGHRMAMLNYDHMLAIYLGAAYIHRVSHYGSLSPDSDPMQVERFFGWNSINDTRPSILKAECQEEIRPSQARHCQDKKEMMVICQKLRPTSSFKHLVPVPTALADCVSNTPRDPLACADALRQFGNLHNEPDTLFYLQVSPKVCAVQHRSVSFRDTATWLRSHYWKFHRHTTLLSQNEHLRNRTTITRVLPFDEDRLQIAVHIRRGDFFNYTNRALIPDAAYADMIVASKRAADIEFAHNVPTTVSIFSEGIPKEGSRFRSMHNMDEMVPIYLTDHGEQIRDANGHWLKLVLDRMPKQADVRVQVFIATDTITAIHAMICADVFVGSKSALSTNIVEHLTRGVALMPADDGKKPPRRTSGSASIRFGYRRIDTAEVHMDELRDSLRTVLHPLPWKDQTGMLSMDQNKETDEYDWNAGKHTMRSSVVLPPHASGRLRKG